MVSTRIKRSDIVEVEGIHKTLIGTCHSQHVSLGSRPGG